MATYDIHQVGGRGLSLESMKSGDTVQFQVRADDGVIAWRGTSYFVDGLSKRQIGGLRLQADNMRKRYQAHFDRTGKRFELEEDERRLESHMASIVKAAAAEAKASLSGEAWGIIESTAAQTEQLVTERCQALLAKLTSDIERRVAEKVEARKKSLALSRMARS